MKRKSAFILCCAMSLSLLLTACGSGASTPSSQPSQQPTPTGPAKVEYTQGFKTATTGINDLKAECDQKGTVVGMDYETPLYVADTEQIVTKRLYVYLPYGYDETKSYDILYLMHGGGESEEYWLAGERWGPTTCNTLDNMIKNGICDPFIVVTPTFNSTDREYEKGKDLTTIFADELRNNVIPAVESVYSTYANGDTNEENLIATRDHRAFAGFSMGSMTSIHSVLMKNLDMFSWIGSYSGAKTEVSDCTAALESAEYKDLNIKFWFNGNGKGDIAHDEHDEFCHGVVEAMPDRFTDGENFAWIDLRDGTHSYASWLTHLYNCMLVFFK